MADGESVVGVIFISQCSLLVNFHFDNSISQKCVFFGCERAVANGINAKNRVADGQEIMNRQKQRVIGVQRIYSNINYNEAEVGGCKRFCILLYPSSDPHCGRRKLVELAEISIRYGCFIFGHVGITRNPKYNTPRPRTHTHTLRNRNWNILREGLGNNKLISCYSCRTHKSDEEEMD